MKTTTLLATFVSFLAPLAGAQEERPEGAQDPKARLEVLQTEMRQIVSDWQEQARAARAEAERARQEGKPVPALPMRPDFSPLVPKYESAAKDYAGTPDALPFLTWLLTSMADGEAAKRAAAAIAKDHAASGELQSIVSMLPYMERAIGAEAASALRQAIREKNRDPNVLALLALAEHEDTIENAERDSDAYQAARRTLLAAAEKATDAEVKARLQGVVDLREKLSSGSIAPDIEGIDLDGVAFKLSDYKGKVIFLDFWGDW